ncbi:unnamed protein product [Leptidea sinapis]|uniref:Kazal-like domain-containing protein n=1 Tax=Leptidea sinapis TaxID=189913 RepID=A0A5E4PZV9_9NEOP|nr:unnamed protein product [Leptidea sinapis]
MYFLIVVSFLTLFCEGEGKGCDIVCPMVNEPMICTFDIHNKIYKMFPSECAMAGFAQCYKILSKLQ